MKKILILKSFDDNFEQLFSKAMRQENVDVFPLFDFPENPIKSFLYKVVKNLNIKYLTGLILPSYKYDIKNYDDIIVFDRNLKKSLVDWLCEKAKDNTKIYVWYWNIPKKPVPSNLRYKRVIFDEDYAHENNMAYCHQFFAPKILDMVNVKVKEGVITYVGYNKNRLQKLEEYANLFQQYGLVSDFTLIDTDGNQSQTVSLIHHSLQYQDVLKKELAGEFLLELAPDQQKGLTMRALEAMFARRKLVTTCTSIKEQPFYHPNNIFVLGVDDMNEFAAYMKQPFVDIEENILNQFTYEHWLNCLLEIQ